MTACDLNTGGNPRPFPPTCEPPGLSRMTAVYHTLRLAPFYGPRIGQNRVNPLCYISSRMSVNSAKGMAVKV